MEPHGALGAEGKQGGAWPCFDKQLMHVVVGDVTAAAAAAPCSDEVMPSGIPLQGATRSILESICPSTHIYIRSASQIPGTMKVSVKWGKEVFSDIDVDVTQPPLVFKSQLFTLSGVPPDRQKVMIKGALLKDDEWGKAVPKDSMTIMMMGTADPISVEAPKNAPVFVEDLPEHEQDTLGTKAYGSGLTNLGNTCYMNSTVQCLYSVGALQSALAQYTPAAAVGGDSSTKLVAATKELFADLKKGGSAFPPFKFLITLRERFPQFAQTNNHGEFMQQDAEECYSQIMYTLREKLKVGGKLALS